MTQEMTDRAFARYALDVRRRLQEWDAARRVPTISGLELNADLEREWARQDVEAKARATAERHAIDTRLEIDALAVYQRLGRAIGGVTSEESWVGLAEEVDRLVEERELSSRHGAELKARLLRVAKDRRWTDD